MKIPDLERAPALSVLDDDGNVIGDKALHEDMLTEEADAAFLEIYAAFALEPDGP